MRLSRSFGVTNDLAHGISAHPWLCRILAATADWRCSAEQSGDRQAQGAWDQEVVGMMWAVGGFLIGSSIPIMNLILIRTQRKGSK